MSDIKFRSVLFDTNVWLDSYMGFRRQCADASKAISLANENDLVIYYCPTSLKDVFYTIGNTLKAQMRLNGEEVTQQRALSIREIARGCADNMSWLGISAPLGEGQVRRAMMLKGTYPDLEDDLILACLEVEGIDAFVTSDKALLGKSPVPAFTPATFIEYLQSWG